MVIFYEFDYLVWQFNRKVGSVLFSAGFCTIPSIPPCYFHWKPKNIIIFNDTPKSITIFKTNKKLFRKITFNIETQSNYRNGSILLEVIAYLRSMFNAYWSDQKNWIHFSFHKIISSFKWIISAWSSHDRSVEYSMSQMKVSCWSQKNE